MLTVTADKAGSGVILHCEGRIVTGEAIRILRNAVEAQTEACAVIIDLAQIDVLDAGGLGVLLELRQWSEVKGIELRLINVTKVVRQVLEITRLDTVFKADSQRRTKNAANSQVERIPEPVGVWKSDES